MTTLIRPDEVSSKYGIPEDTLRYWRHVGPGPEWAKLGRRVVYRLEDVEKWIAEQSEATKASA